VGSLDDSAFPVRPADEPGMEKADPFIPGQYAGNGIYRIVKAKPLAFLKPGRFNWQVGPIKIILHAEASRLKVYNYAGINKQGKGSGA
jgi:hypothetical protein